jgi:leucine dehydrogenase
VTGVFSHPDFDEHERVLHWADRASGLRAIVAIHRVRSGRAVGGCRVRDYASDDEALTDVLRLSRGMTYKTALAGLRYGGAKAVICGRPSRDALRAFGRAVASLGGAYVTAEDVGMRQSDLAVIREETEWVLGADDVGGVAAPFTALGVFHALRGALRHVRGSDSLDGVGVAVQGAGSVGARMCDLLHDAGAVLVVADVDDAAAREVALRTGARVVAPDAIHEQDVDVFAPCALGAVLNERTIPALRARIVVGAANNQLATTDDDERLAARGIAYVPDVVASAGGVTNGVSELDGYDREDVLARLERIADTAEEVLAAARRDGVPTSAAAEALAMELVAR